MRRIRVNLIFEEPVDGDSFWNSLKQLASKSKFRNLNSESSFIEYEECGHDQGLPCSIIQKVLVSDEKL